MARILGAFKLNPFEQLGLRFDATYEDIRRQYRKVGLTLCILFRRSILSKACLKRVLIIVFRADYSMLQGALRR